MTVSWVRGTTALGRHRRNPELLRRHFGGRQTKQTNVKVVQVVTTAVKKRNQVTQQSQVRGLRKKTQRHPGASRAKAGWLGAVSSVSRFVWLSSLCPERLQFLIGGEKAP